VAPISRRSASGPCPHFGTCGGCAFQDRAYGDALREKQDALAQSFEKAGVRAELAPIESAPERWFYRNRMSFIVGPGPAIGLRKPGRWDEIVDLGTCLLLSEPAHAVVNATREFLRTRGIEPYDLRRGSGEARYLIVREGKNTGQRLVMPIARTAGFPFDDFADLVRGLGCTGAALAVHAGPSDVASGEVVRTAGQPLEERIGGAIFEISPNSFFQPSTRLAERLVEVARALLCEGTALVDFYCGVGLFAIALCDRFARVIGVESDAGAARDAVRNAARNGAANVEIFAGEIERTLPSIGARLTRGTSAVVDPPRSGMRRAAIAALLASPVDTVLYVSCNPATMARDLAALGSAFRIDGPVLSFDSLPWTPHVEVVARLVRKG
jgi:23S rRNA (uracil1939-C5)-methyltransferase